MQPNQDGGERTWWWRVAQQLGLAHVALINARAYNVDDPKLVNALEAKIREAQALLFTVFKAKNMLPPHPGASPAATPPGAPPMKPSGAAFPSPPPGVPIPPMMPGVPAAGPIVSPLQAAPVVPAPSAVPIAPVPPPAPIAVTAEPIVPADLIAAATAPVADLSSGTQAADDKQATSKQQRKAKKATNGSTPHSAKDQEPHENGSSAPSETVAAAVSSAEPSTAESAVAETPAAAPSSETPRE